MEKPFNEFGGWLRFFWVTTMLTLIFYVIAFIGNFAPYLKENSAININFIVTQLEFTLCAVFALYVFKYLKKQDPTSPKKIVSLLLASALVTLPGLIFRVIFPNNSQSTSSLNTNYFLIMAWTLYFKESKRVKIYYGENAVFKIKWFSKKGAGPEESQSRDQQKV